MRRKFTPQEEGGTAPEGGGETIWDKRMQDFYTFMEFLRTTRTGESRDELGRPVRPEGMDPEFYDRFGGSVDKYMSATELFASTITATFGRGGQRGVVGREGPVAAVGTATATQGPEVYLPIIMKEIRQLYPEVPFGPTEIEIPEPLGVNVSPTEMAQGVAMGTLQTGMPFSMMAMSQAQAAQASATTALIYYLMVIASNTAQPATTTVVVEGGTTTTTTTPTTAPVTGPPGMMTDWYLGGGSGVVPT